MKKKILVLSLIALLASTFIIGFQTNGIGPEPMGSIAQPSGIGPEPMG